MAIATSAQELSRDTMTSAEGSVAPTKSTTQEDVRPDPVGPGDPLKAAPQSPPTCCKHADRPPRAMPTILSSI